MRPSPTIPTRRTGSDIVSLLAASGQCDGAVRRTALGTPQRRRKVAAGLHALRAHDLVATSPSLGHESIVAAAPPSCPQHTPQHRLSCGQRSAVWNALTKNAIVVTLAA